MAGILLCIPNNTTGKQRQALITPTPSPKLVPLFDSFEKALILRIDGYPHADHYNKIIINNTFVLLVFIIVVLMCCFNCISIAM